MRPKKSQGRGGERIGIFSETQTGISHREIGSPAAVPQLRPKILGIQSMRSSAVKFQPVLWFCGPVMISWYIKPQYVTILLNTMCQYSLLGKFSCRRPPPEKISSRDVNRPSTKWSSALAATGWNTPPPIPRPSAQESWISAFWEILQHFLSWALNLQQYCLSNNLILT